MRVITTLSTLFWLGACTAADSNDPEGNPGTDGATRPTVPEVVDTGWAPGDLAGFHIALGSGDAPARLMGVATESSPGFLNLAQCAVNPDSPCLTLFPNMEDDFVALATGLEVDREATQTRFLGREVELAGYTLAYQEDADNGFGFYDRQLAIDDLAPQGWVNVSWGGQWPAYEGEQMLFVSEPIDLLSPVPGSSVEFSNGSSLPIAWTPTGSGAVTLILESESGLSRMYLLEDDGYFELEADSLTIGGTTDDIRFSLIRWDQNNVRRFGHVIDFVATSTATFDATYFNIGPRDELQPAAQCAEATGQDPLTTGGYWGSLDPALGANLGGLQQPPCIAPGCAHGYDGFYKLELPPKHLISLQYNVLEDSAAFWMVEDCFAPLDCSEPAFGADEDSTVGVPEFISYFNPTDDLQRFYLVVDSQGETCNPGSQPPVESKFTLDVNLQPLLEPAMYDNCEQAEDAPNTFLGSYYGEFTAYVDDLNPGIGGCTGTSMPGADAMTPVEVPAGQTLTVNVRMPGANPAIYFLYQCDDPFSCPAGSDASLGEEEVGVYQNTGTVTERIYVVVDSEDGILPYFLSMQL